jgi:hypothetical protein
MRCQRLYAKTVCTPNIYPKTFGYLKKSLYFCSLKRFNGSLGFAASRVEELFVAQVLIKKVKLKCCGI